MPIQGRSGLSVECRWQPVICTMRTMQSLDGLQVRSIRMQITEPIAYCLVTQRNLLIQQQI